jgi:hypothetical protein
MNTATIAHTQSAQEPSFRPASFEEQMIYQRAFETAIWATPILESLQMRAELRKFGAPDGTIAYFGSRPTGNIELPTFNNTVAYAFGTGSLKDGPMVIDMPASGDEAKYFGSFYNVWDSAYEDFGPEGLDQGKGGKYVLLPPGWKGTVPAGYTAIQSSSYSYHFWLRSIAVREGDEGWADALEYSKTLKIYPLADAASPKPNVWFDITKVEGYFHGNPFLDLNTFKLLDEYVQEEPVQECDKAMHGMLAFLGMQKGKPFAPDARTAKIIDQAARDAEIYMRGELESGRAFAPPYWPDRTWAGFNISPDVVRSGTTWNYPDRLDYHARAVNWYYFGVGLPKRFAGSAGATFYLSSTKDAEGKTLDGAKSYRLSLPKNVPAKDFWSLILYSTRTRSFLDTKKFGLSSKDSPQVNADGSIDLYLGPNAPAGKESNWLETKAGERYFGAFRFYGPSETLRNKTWKLGNFELVK